MRNSKELSRMIAERYINENPRTNFYEVVMTSTIDSSEESHYVELSDEEIALIRAYKSMSEDDDEYGIDLYEYLDNHASEEFIERISRNNSPYPVNLIQDVDIDNSVKFVPFTLRVVSVDGTLEPEMRVNIVVSDEELAALLSELIIRRNRLSVNQLTYVMPELHKRIVEHICEGYYQTPFELSDPFICEMNSLKEAVNSIMNPLIDRYHFFESDDEELRSFMLSRQIAPDFEELYTEETEEHAFHCIASFRGKVLNICQESYLLKLGCLTDIDEFNVDTRSTMDHFGVSTPEELLAYLKAHFAGRDCLARIRKELD